MMLPTLLVKPSVPPVLQALLHLVFIPILSITIVDGIMLMKNLSTPSLPILKEVAQPM
jgi:fructose-specific phosphotransferase system IIC component